MPIPRRLVAALAILTILSALASPAGHTAAASCSGNSHALTLSGGAAAPGSGTTDTKFTFRVTYADNDGCAPDRIVVVVVGVGTFGLSYVAGGLQSGATFARSMRLPAGRWAYRFEASSGSGAGQRQAKLTKVTPSRVIVARPTPDPTQQPVATPVPTPRRTAAPTKSPPTPRPSVSATATPIVSPPMPTPAVAPATVGPSRAPMVAVNPTAPDPGAPIALLKLLVALIGTVGGLVLFAALAGRLLPQAPGIELPPVPTRRREDPATEAEPTS